MSYEHFLKVFNAETFARAIKKIAKTKEEKLILIGYCSAIHDLPRFKEDPVKYMESWKRHRGTTEIYMFPGDAAMKVFNDLVRKFQTPS